MKRAKSHIFSVSIVLLIFCFCTNEQASKRRIEKEIKTELAKIEDKKHLECMALARDSAERIVDSLIFSQNVASDSFKNFNKPLKPIKPVVKSPLDTTHVSPIFKQN